MARKRHPDRDIEAAVAYAEARGWRVKPGQPRSHSWGTMLCPNNDSDCRCGEFCKTSIWSTPRSPHSHARDLKQVVDNCTGRESEDG
jgi:hypothetical protein